MSKGIADLSPEQKALLAMRLMKKAAQRKAQEGTPSDRLRPVPREGELPLSFAQQRLWFIEQFNPGSSAYNVPFAVRLTGELDAEALRRTLEEVVRRHEILRTIFASAEGRTFQVVAPPGPLPMPVIDLSGLGVEAREAELQRLATAEARRAFDLTRGPLFRVTLLRLGEEGHVVLLSMHHIVSDGWSIGILIREVAALYESFRAGRPSPLAELPVQYADFAHWQRTRMRGEVLEAELAYWRKRLGGAAELLELPTDRPRPPAQSFRGTNEVTTLPAKLAASLRDLSKSEGVTLFMTLLASFEALLYRYTGQEDFSVGTVVAGRNRVELENLIGFFTNNLVLRADVAGDPTFRELLRRVRVTTLEAFAHQDVPFEKLVDELQPARHMSYNPLFQVMLILQNAPAEPFELPGLKLSPVFTEFGTSKLDLTLTVEETGGGLSVSLEYSTDLFDAATIKRLLGHWRTLLGALAADPARRLSELPLLTAPERRRLLSGFNRTARSLKTETTIHQLFEEQTAHTPDAVAVTFEGARLTYAELNERADLLARHLRQLGVGPDTLVGVMMERSLEIVVSILGVLKAGGAYVPLDPSYPQERLRFMLEDSGVRVLLTQARLAGSVAGVGAHVVAVDAQWEEIARDGDDAPAAGVTPDSLAYVIYTSGSTGRPKGVMIEHRSILNRLLWMVAEFKFGSGERVLQKTSLSFDASVWELFAPLLSGGCLVLAKPGGHQDGAYLVETIEHERITILQLVPSMLQVFLEEQGLEHCRSLRRLFCGGETLGVRLKERFYEVLPRVELHNLYGPTEVSIDATHWKVKGDEQRSVPIGRPIANTRIHLLDPRMEPVPVGVAGELYVAGVGLARGYLNRPALTAERFVPDPFSTEVGARLYRTGDVARRRADGPIEYLGRADHQVKVRGFRIELGEIESALASHPHVRETVVTAREDDAGHKRLVAYVVGRNGDDADGAGLKEFLEERLPDYMVPALFVRLPELPRQNNGKIDVRALPDPGQARPQLKRGYVAPQTEVERQLAQVWSEVLGVEQVGINDNFFELGGDSILTLQITAAARRAGLRVTARKIFQYPTIAELAAVVDDAPAAEAEAEPSTGSVPLTPIQRDFFERGDADPHHYNQSVLLEVRRPLRPELLARVLRRLLRQHDALRLRFVKEKRGWRQFTADDTGALPLTVVDLSALPEAEQRGALEAAAASVQASLNPAEGPLMRVVLFGLGEGRPGRLLIVLHHLATDGVSWRILLEDLQRAYAQAESGREIELAPATTSFKRWAELLARHAESGAVDDEADYWLGQSARRVEPLRADHSGGDDTVATLANVSVSLSEEETRALLHDAPAAYHTQINDILLTALALAVNEHTGGTALCLDLEGHGREEIMEGVDLSRTVGWFTTVFPVVLDLDGARDEGEALMRVKEQLRAIPNRGIGYGLLKHLGRDARVAEELRRRGPSEISFNYLGQFDQTVSEESGLAGARESGGPGVSPHARLRHLLDVNGSVMGGRLELDWSYSRSLFDEETVRGLTERYLGALRRVIAHCLAAERPVYTPSDFPLARLHQEEIDGLLVGGEEVEDVYALAPLQEGLLFHTLSAPASGVYMQQMSCRFNKGFDVEAFKRSWEELLARHPVLRTGFEWRGVGEPVQVVRRRVPLEVREEDWRGLGRDERAEMLERFLREDRARGFDVSRPPLVRLALMREGEDAYRLVWSFHHLVLDGWSVGTVIQEIFEGYERQRRGLGPAERGGARPYRDYIRWLSRQDMARAEGYWRERLKGFRAPTPLSFACAPHDADAPAEVGHGEQELRLPPELKEFARRQGLTLNTVVQGAWALLLSRYSGERDVLFGAVVSGRPAALPGVETMVGLFINTLPVRVEVEGGERVGDWLRALQEQQVETRQYEYSPLVQVQGWSDVPRSLPLFESILVFENFPSPDSSIKEQGEALEVTEIRTLEQTNYPLTILASSDADASLMLRYDRARFDEETIARLLGHWETLLRAMAADASRRLADLPVLAPEERRQLLDDFNRTARALPYSNTLHRLFETQARRRPEAVAVTFEGTRLSYAELDARADALASYLRARGVGPESVVAVLMERSLEMVVALYGVLKAGGAYLPVEPTYPEARIAYMLEDSRPALVLTQGRLRAKAAGVAEVVALDEQWNEVEAERAGDADVKQQAAAGPENLAYVIYTSGSTGRPKAVMSTHRGICNRLLWMQEEYRLDETDVVLQKTPFSFDVSVWEFFWPLLTGARLAVARPGGHQDAGYLANVINEQQVTTLHFVPSMLQVFVESLEKCPDVRRVICSGEALPPELVARFFQHSRAELHNLYGPTEASVDVTFWECRPGEERRGVPIGRPIANTRIHLLDPRMEPVPVSVAGELYIAGVGLARGYLNRPALTAERFVPDPFSTEVGGRLYRTGDVARRRADGAIEYLGRVDHQVKVRGFRIELGEIETALTSHPRVREAVVIAREQGGGEKSLVGYLVAEEGSEVGARELREYLRERLPEYMTPSAFVSLSEMPLSSNGKVDRAHLPEPQHARAAAEKPPSTPADEVERRLLDIWEDLFKVRPLSTDDDFFEIGGHSILALRLMSRVAREFGHELPLATLFERPTVLKLAALLRRHAEARPWSPLVPIRTTGGHAPFFCVHPSGGNVLCYLELSRALGDDYPFYGLQDPPDFEGARRHSDDIEEMAARYVELLREVQGSGPYLLGGYSFGGVVAFEMARQLRGAGQEVGLLALLDTAAPHASRRLLELEERMGVNDGVMLALDLNEHARQTGAEPPLDLQTLWRLGAEEQLAYVVERGAAAGLLPPEVGRGQVEHYLELHRSRRRAVLDYAPGVYDGPFMLLRAAEPGDEELRELEGVAEPEVLREWRGEREATQRRPALDWARLCAREPEVSVVPGTHHTMLFGANAAALAAVLKGHIDRSAAGGPAADAPAAAAADDPPASVDVH